MDIELTPDALVGFRSWRIFDHFLNPTYQPTDTWHKPGNVEAECFRSHHYMYPALKDPPPEHSEEHTAPLGTCTCGIYAYYKPEPRPRDGDCWGAIVAWGHIIECEFGFKTQYARPIALLEPGTDRSPEQIVTERIVTVAERYELPLLPLDELAQYALMFGEIRTT